MAERFWNVVSLQGDKDAVSALRSFISFKGRDSVDRVFDFNTVLPVPSSLCLPYSPATFLSYFGHCVVVGGRKSVKDSYWELYLYRLFLREKDRFGSLVSDYVSYIRYCDSKNLHGIRLSVGEQYARNLSLYGFGTSYDWMRENWGVSCNSYGGEHISVSKFCFSVNDGVPLRLYQRLSEKFPDVLVTVRYAGDFNGKRNGFLQFFGGIKQQSEEYSRKDRFPLLGNGLKQVSCPDDLVSVRWRSVSGCRGVPFVLGLVSGR